MVWPPLTHLDVQDAVAALRAASIPNFVIPQVVGDGTTDDRAAIQAALNSLPATGGTVWLPSLCAIGSGGNSGGAPIGVVIPRDNVTLTGPPGAGLTSAVAGIRLLIATGHAKTNAADPYDTTQWVTSLTPMPVSPIAEGATTITFTNSGDAATLAAGDLIFIRTGQLVDAVQSREPDSELNEVLSVAGSVVTLKYPTAKSYAQEYYITGTTGMTSTSVTANAAPFGVAKVSGRILRNFTVKGLKILQTDSTTGTATGVQMQSCWGVNIEDCEVNFGKYGIGARYARQVRITRTNLHTLGAASDNDPAWIGPSTGCSDWVIQSCRGSGVVPAKLHGHEGVADLRYLDWQSRTPNGAGQSAASNISVRARAYRHVYDVDMTGSYTTTSTDMLAVTSEVVGEPGQVHFRRLRLRGAPARSFLNIGSSAVTIDPNTIDLPVGATALLTTGIDALNDSITISAAQMTISGLTPSLESGAMGSAWLLDQTLQESVSASIRIPARWRLWQVLIDVQATTAPVAGTGDTARFQFATASGGGSITSGGQLDVVLPDATTMVTATMTPTQSTTGPLSIRLQRLSAAGTDTYAADVRLRSVVLRRLA